MQNCDVADSCAQRVPHNVLEAINAFARNADLGEINNVAVAAQPSTPYLSRLPAVVANKHLIGIERIAKHIIELVLQ